MTTTLITGANKGLGRETARRLVEAGHDVWLGARREDAGREAAEAVGGRFVALDVTDDASVAAAIATIGAAGGLDVLVNNAAIAGGTDLPLQTDLGLMDEVLRANVTGPLRVAIAAAPLLERSADPVVVNVSSSLGSAVAHLDADGPEASYPPVAYPASKAALNLVTLKLARALPHARVLSVTPGFTATDLNDNTGTKTVEQGAEAIVVAALGGPEVRTATFVDEDGPVRW